MPVPAAWPRQAAQLLPNRPASCPAVRLPLHHLPAWALMLPPVLQLTLQPVLQEIPLALSAALAELSNELPALPTKPP